MSSLPDLILWGASGHARVIADIVRLQGSFNLVGYIDDVHPERKGELFCGAPVLGGSDELIQQRASGCTHVIIAMGDSAARMSCAERAMTLGFSFATAIHPRAIVAHDATIGLGTVIMAGAIVNSGTTIGRHVIINTGAGIDHDGCIGDGAHIAPGARLAGNVTIGSGTWIGMGSLVKEKVTIGRNCMVGAGSLVLNSIPDGSTAWGSPAKIQKGNQ